MGCMAFAFAAMAGITSAQEVEKSAEKANSIKSKFATTVIQLGVLRCADRADQVSRYLSRLGNEVVVVDRLAQGKSAEMVTATMLIPSGSDDFVTAEISLFPSESGCSASYAATIYSKDSCSTAEKKYFGDLKFTALEKLPYKLSMINANTRVLSKQLNTGCLLTKHESVR